MKNYLKKLYKDFYKVIGSKPFFIITAKKPSRVSKKLSKRLTADTFIKDYIKHIELNGSEKYCDNVSDIINHLVWINITIETKKRMINWLIQNNYFSTDICAVGYKTALYPAILYNCFLKMGVK